MEIATLRGWEISFSPNSNQLSQNDSKKSCRNRSWHHVLRGGAHRRLRQAADHPELRRRDAFAFGVRDDLRLAVKVDVRHRAERGATIDSERLSYMHLVLVCMT